jgi:hypothetical protein
LTDGEVNLLGKAARAADTADGLLDFTRTVDRLDDFGDTARAMRAGDDIYDTAKTVDKAGELSGALREGNSLRERASEVGNVSKTVGRDLTDYKGTSFKQHPDLEGKVVVHHGVEQQVLRRPETSGLFAESEIHSYENLRGIPNELNSDLHLSKIRKEWNKFYRDNPFPTKDDLLNKRQEIDEMFWDLFNPPIKR